MTLKSDVILSVRVSREIAKSTTEMYQELKKGIKKDMKDFEMEKYLDSLHDLTP